MEMGRKMSIQNKLRELLHSRGGQAEYAGHGDSQHSDGTPAPGHRVGAEGGDESPSADRSPAMPSNDGSPLGDTDQHSQAYRPPAQS
jgi:hypothetical protein